MNLDDFLSAIKRLEDHDARYKALETAMLEQSAQMAEILQHLTKQGPETAKAIAEALKGIKFAMPDSKPAQVNVTVPEIKIPAIKMPDMPAMPAANDWSRLSVAIKQPNGPDRVMTITKTK